MRLIIDSDPIVYRSGFAAEKTTLHVVLEDGDGNLFDWKLVPEPGQTANAKLEEFLAKSPSLAVVEKRKEVIAEPVSHALQGVKNTLGLIEDAVYTAHMQEEDRRLTMTCVLSGPGNYRYAIAKQKPYKGNRDPSHIPVHYQAIRDYLTETHNARVIHGREADDEVSILAHQARAEGVPYVVASIDKDLDQVPGLHYDYMKHVFYEVSEEDAERNFWIQVIAGDSGDNIPGCWKIGRGKAELVVDTVSEHIWEHVVCMYRDSQSRKDCPYKDADPEAVALETAQLVYIQKRPRELWTPKGITYLEQGSNDD